MVIRRCGQPVVIADGDSQWDACSKLKPENGVAKNFLSLKIEDREQIPELRSGETNNDGGEGNSQNTEVRRTFGVRCYTENRTTTPSRREGDTEYESTKSSYTLTLWAIESSQRSNQLHLINQTYTKED